MTDLTVENREHFNKHASDHQTDFADLIQAVIDEFQTRRLWISRRWTDNADSSTGDQRDVRLLDYACGAGTVSKALVPFVSEAVGLDLAENMVEEYNKWARENGFGPERMSAHQCDLLAEPDTTTVGEKHEEFSDFDIIAVSMALHHVVIPGLLLQRFAKRLRGKAGVCVVLDMVPTGSNAPNLDGADLPDELRTVLKTVNKRGFTEDEMRRLYEDAGLGKNFEYVVIDHPFEFTMFGQKGHITGFIARGELA